MSSLLMMASSERAKVHEQDGELSHFSVVWVVCRNFECARGDGSFDSLICLCKYLVLLCPGDLLLNVALVSIFNWFRGMYVCWCYALGRSSSS